MLLGAASGLGLGLLALVSVPVLFGCRSLVVMSGSMEPAVHTGSVVVVERIPADRVAVGDVISFVDPDDPSRLITHRVHGLSLQAGGLAVETQGDANSGREEWRIDPEGTVGRVRLQVPLLGYLLGPLQGRASRLLLVVVPAALLALLLLFSIWRREESGLERPGSSGRRPRLSVGRLPSPAGREAR